MLATPPRRSPVLGNPRQTLARSRAQGRRALSAGGMGSPARCGIACACEDGSTAGRWASPASVSAFWTATSELPAWPSRTASARLAKTAAAAESLCSAARSSRSAVLSARESGLLPHEARVRNSKYPGTLMLRSILTSAIPTARGASIKAQRANAGSHASAALHIQIVVHQPGSSRSCISVRSRAMPQLDLTADAREQ